MVGPFKGGEDMPRRKEKSEQREDDSQILDETREILKLNWEFHRLARIGDFNFPGADRADKLLYEIIVTLETAKVPPQEVSRARRGKEGEVTELSRKIFAFVKKREPEAEDEISLRWIATRLRRALNDDELRQLRRDHNFDPCPQNL